MCAQDSVWPAWLERLLLVSDSWRFAKMASSSLLWGPPWLVSVQRWVVEARVSQAAPRRAARTQGLPVTLLAGTSAGGTAAGSGGATGGVGGATGGNSGPTGGGGSASVGVVSCSGEWGASREVMAAPASRYLSSPTLSPDELKSFTCRMTESSAALVFIDWSVIRGSGLPAGAARHRAGCRRRPLLSLLDFRYRPFRRWPDHLHGMLGLSPWAAARGEAHPDQHSVHPRRAGVRQGRHRALRQPRRALRLQRRLRRAPLLHAAADVHALVDFGEVRLRRQGPGL